MANKYLKKMACWKDKNMKKQMDGWMAKKIYEKNTVG